MAEPWSKEADWIPYFNALEQVIFWKDDLIKAEKSLYTLEQTGRYKSTDREIVLSKKEIAKSKYGLKVAQFKLKRSLARITQSDKDAWPEDWD